MISSYRKLAVFLLMNGILATRLWTSVNFKIVPPAVLSGRHQASALSHNVSRRQSVQRPILDFPPYRLQKQTAGIRRVADARGALRAADAEWPDKRLTLRQDKDIPRRSF